MNAREIIDETEINQLLAETENIGQAEIELILEKALKLKGLSLRETAALLNLEGQALKEKLFSAALEIKKRIYGNRLVLFAPLYISNYCSNNCLYCGFRQDNQAMKRKKLSLKEVAEETKLILQQGHKRILMLMGDSPECSFDYFLQALETAYAIKDKDNSIRRINVEIQPLSLKQFKELKEAKIGTFTCFQETYHQETYKKMHPSGEKADYGWRLTAMDRAQEAGIDDVGIGALFGLYDYRFEVLALLQHANYLDEKFGVGPHTISIPRLKPALNAPAANQPPYPVNDADFKKLVAVIRCAVPYTGMILSTRESPQVRQEIFNLGISQISAGSKTSPGGYRDAKINPENEEQFSLEDTRSTEQVIRALIQQKFIPSFCTACYRLGRTGQDFMDLAKPGLIQNFCQPNALLTLQEYLEDYAGEKTKALGEALIARETEKIKDEKRKQGLLERLDRIKQGERDLYF